MALALAPPVESMLARLVQQIPHDGFVYEPKLDGFRVLAFWDDSIVALRSRIWVRHLRAPIGSL